MKSHESFFAGELLAAVNPILPRRLAAWVLAASLCVTLLNTSASATDITWTNGNGGWDTTVFWNPNSVPGAGDRAIFNDSATIASYAVGLNIGNRSVGDVLFSATTKGMFWKNSTNTLTVNNSFILDQTAGATAVDTLRTGTIAVTNDTGTAVVDVGSYTSGGKGLLTMQHQGSAGDTSITNYPALMADSFLVTSNSTFTFTAGTLTTLHGSTIDRGANATADTIWNPVAGDIVTWNMQGGSNSINYLGSIGTNRVAFTSGGTVNVNVSGAGTYWNVGGAEFDIGWNGFANLTISGGAHVTNSSLTILSRNGASSSNNSVTVTGTGSQWNIGNEVRVGNAAKNNSLMISAGGVVTATSGRMGEGTLSAGNSATVTGANSVWTLGDFLQIGGGGASNVLTISDGGVVNSAGSATPTRLGRDVTSSDNSALVDGNGSLWSITGTGGFVVGNSGPHNSLTIQNGGAVSVVGGPLRVGIGASSTNNIVTVTGGSIVVTNGGTGSLNVSRGSLTFNGGTITADQLTLNTGATSVFTFNSGLLNIGAGGSTVNNGSVFTVGNGVNVATLNLGGGTNSFANGLTISSQAFLRGNGVIIGNVANSGTLSPGNSAGSLAFAGNLTLAGSSVLAMEIGGTLAGQFDQISISNGAFAVDGTLTVSLINGFNPSSGDSFHLFDFTSATSTSGVFAAVSLPSLGGGLSWDSSQLLVTGDLSVVPEPSTLALVIGGCFLGVLVNRRQRK